MKVWPHLDNYFRVKLPKTSYNNIFYKKTAFNQFLMTEKIMAWIKVIFNALIRKTVVSMATEQ